MRCTRWVCPLLLLGCGHASAPSPGGAGGIQGAAGNEAHGGQSGAGVGGLASSGTSGSSGAGGAPEAASGVSGVGGAVTSGERGGAGAEGDGGGAAACPPPSTTLSAWSGSVGVVTLDAAEDFGSDLSGLAYESPGVLWAVNNLSSTLFRLVKSDNRYRPDTGSQWSVGKSLRFRDGTGAPDSEGVTLGLDSASGVYVSSERNLSQPQVSRLSVLRYDVSAEGITLNATHEWDVTALLPAVDPNAGLEAITWVGDAGLTARGFFDESRDKPYAPSDYGDHGGGMFLVGVEQTGKVYGFSLDHVSGAATLLTTISTPLSGVMGMEMDRDAGELWAYCDDTCDNQAAVFGIAPSGRFELERRVRSPSGLPGSNNEGIALAPDSECSGGVKPFFWTDDADASGFSLRQGELSCGCR